jgi:alkylhydroperoxidase family enzyme
MIRIQPLEPPYDARIQEDFDKLMPPGIAPIGLFRTVAKNARVLRRLRRGGLLDPGSISVREREIVILRTTARAGAEYEWGVHAAFFPVLTEEEVRATVQQGPEAWKEPESLLVRIADELHETARIADATWESARAHFSEEQLIEVMMLCGFYRAVSYVVNGSGVALESGARRFPAK